MDNSIDFSKKKKMASIFTKLRKTGDESNSSFFHKKWIFKNIPSLKFNQEILGKIVG
jgi:hypothetical protein